MPLNKAIKINQELTQLYTTGCRDKNQYFNIVKQYANLQFLSLNKNNSTWELNGKTYTMYHSFSNLDINCNMFVEDATMMIYRLFSGKGYNTMSLCDMIKEEQLKQLEDQLQYNAENSRNEVYWI